MALSLSLLNAQEYALFDAGARRVTAPVASDLAHFEFYRLALRASVGLTPAAMTSSGLVQCDDSLSLSLPRYRHRRTHTDNGDEGPTRAFHRTPTGRHQRSNDVSHPPLGNAKWERSHVA